jgi:Rrf2 family cysteine metabolism transcriptional repressor
MKLSTKGRYAVRSMVDLALHANESPVTREEIAARQEISGDYLARLFAKLVKAGLISSVKGPGGGYVLAQSPAAITTGDIIRAVEESLAPVYCVNADVGTICHRVDGCVTHLLWERLGRRITELLDSVTLEELREHAQDIQTECELQQT